MDNEKNSEYDSILLRAIRTAVKEELEPIKRDVAAMQADITAIKEDIAEIKENAKEVRTSVGAVLDWIDEPEPRPKKLM